MPAAKERGDRGRGTSAFEMVLSPGAGIAGDQKGKPLRISEWQGQQATETDTPPPGTGDGRSSRRRANAAKKV